MPSLVATPFSASPSSPGRRSRSLVVAPEPPLDDVVAELQHAATLKSLARSLAIGRILTDRLYDGDPTAFRSRSAKSTSLRRLVQHGSPFSASALYRALSIYETWSRVDGKRWSSLTASHYRAVEAVPTDGQQQWLSIAAERGWSGAQLRGAIVAGSAHVVSRGGRLPKHPVDRFVTRMERELSGLARVGGHLQVTEAERVRMSELATRLEAIAAQCLDYVRRIRAGARLDDDGVAPP